MVLNKKMLGNKRAVQCICVIGFIALIVGFSLPRFEVFEHESSYMLATHLVLEMFSVVVAILVVVISWQTFRIEDSALARALIFTFTIVAGMDLIHTLSFPGMPDLITSSSTEKGIFFWLMGRIIELCGLFLVLSKFNLRGRLWHWQLAGLLSILFLLMFGTRYLDILPALFVPGQGVTPFKAAIGSLITVGNWIAAGYFWRAAGRGEKPQRNYYFAASCFLVGTGEVCFSTYVTTNEFLVIFGHLFKAGAYIFICLGVFREAMREPYRLLQASEQVLRVKQLELDAVLSHINAGVARLDPGGRCLYINDYLARYFGKSAQEIIGNPFEQFVANAHREEACYHLEKAISGCPTSYEGLRIGPEGRQVYMSAWVTPERNAQGEVIGAVFVIIDMTEQWRTRQLLSESLAQLSDLNMALDAHAIVAITDAQGVITSVNDKFCEISQYSRSELVGKTHSIINSNYHPNSFFEDLWKTIARGRVWTGEICNRAKSGRLYWVSTTIVPFVNSSGQPMRYVAIRADITERKRIEQKIKEMAYHDALTGLPNRRLLMERLEGVLAHSAETNCYSALLLLDLDHFKNVNDTLGHDIGDQLLQDVSDRLMRIQRPRDTVARLGGDEFVVVLVDVGQTEAEASLNTGRICENIIQQLSAPFEIGGSLVNTSPSIGAVLFQGDKVDSTELMKRADISMYEAKTYGRKRVRFFDLSVQQAFQEQLALEGDLRDALKLGQFEIFFQLIVDQSGKTVAQEALLRWRHPTRGLVPPNDFIPSLERTGLILSVGHWVIEQACIMLSQWRTDPVRRDWSLAVNVSPKQLQHPSFVDEVSALLREHRVGNGNLKLEITESTLQENLKKSTEKMRVLIEQGISFAIDDFGTGYSSLSLLRNLPIQILKIDRSFVRQIDHDEKDAAIAQSIVSLANSMGLQVVAEGVETDSQYMALKLLGCQMFQGYLFGKPQPLDSMQEN